MLKTMHSRQLSAAFSKAIKNNKRYELHGRPVEKTIKRLGRL